MHLRHLTLTTLVGLALLAGCTHKHQGAIDTTAVQQIRESYTRVDPNAKVGLVVAMLPEKGLAAVGDVPVADFQVGDVLVLMDTKQQIIGAGHVVAKTDDALHISYDVTAKGRAPQVGDIAVKSK